MSSPKNLTDVINLFITIGTKVIPLLGMIAFLVFIWGVARYIRSAGSEKEIGDSKKLLIWGLVGLFVMVSIWGIIIFLRGDLGFNDAFLIPQIHF